MVSQRPERGARACEPVPTRSRQWIVSITGAATGYGQCPGRPGLSAALYAGLSTSSHGFDGQRRLRASI